MPPKGYVSREERRKEFEKRTAIGKERNEACRQWIAELSGRLNAEEILTYEALSLAWAAGCEYGKEHAEELKLLI